MKRLLIVAILLGGLASSALAADAAPAPRIGVVLGGGGARGFAHLGVLQELDRLGIPISCIAGTSAGALIGGIYASGQPLDRLEETFAHTDWDQLTSGKPRREDVPFSRKREDVRNYLDLSVGIEDGKLKLPRGALNSQPVDLYIRYLTQGIPAGDFDRLPIPFRAVATDLANGDAVVFDKGDLATALRASMAVPGVFDAVEVDGRLLVDGLLARNLPVSDIKGRCADVVIAVDVGEPLKKTEDIRSWFDVLTQSLNFGVSRNVAEQKKLLGPDDILITPALGDTPVTAFADSPRIVEAGRAAVRAQAAQLARYAADPAAYQLWRASLPQTTPGRIESVKVDAPAGRSRRLLEDKLAVPAGGQSQSAFLANLQDVFAEGDYDRLAYRVEGDNGERAVVTPKPRATGPDLLRFGVSMEGASNGDATFAVLASHRRTWVNEAGATWFNETRIGESLYFGSELYQPLSPTSPFFLAGGLRVSKDAFSLYTPEHDRRADLSLRDSRVSLASGVALGRYGEWRLGFFRGQVDTGLRVGDPGEFPSASYRLGGVETRLTIDQVDNPRWPRNGYAVRVDVQRALPDWSAKDYEQLVSYDTGFDYVHTTGADLTWRLTGKARGSTQEGANIASLGGFLNLSGYQNDELLGQRAALARLMGYWRVASLPSALGTGVYVGASAEVGRIWNGLWDGKDSEWLPAASAFVGADTLFGPLFLGVGNGRGGRWTAYFYLGADY